MKSIVEQSHEFLLPILHKGAICIDATLGHGKDTAFFLNKKVKLVYGFEVQKDVLEKTVNQLNDDHLKGIFDGHENMDHYVHDLIDGIIFNFGYCPGLENNIMTHFSTSLIAVQKALNLLRIKGRMVLVFYPHEQGRQEAMLLENYLNSLPSSLYYVEKRTQLNQSDSPYLIGIEKLKSA